MRQRYHISKEGDVENLVIEEFAVISEVPRKKNELQPFEENYTFLCQERYEGNLIKASISRGAHDLIATIRTENMFPISQYIEEIAVSVIDMYRSSEDQSVELFFDDSDQFGIN